MKNHHQPARVTYNDLYFRIITSVAAGHFIVIFGTKIPFFTAITMPGYYIALAGSAIIAFLLVSAVWYVTSWLDKRYDWYEHPYQRSAYQFLFGIVLSALLAFGLAALYFYVRGVNILDTLYLSIDYPVIVLLLLISNAYYLIHYLVRMALADKSDAQLQNSTAREMFAVKGLTDTQLVAVSKIGIFYVNSTGLHLATYDYQVLFCPYLKISDAVKILDRIPSFRSMQERLLISRLSNPLPPWTTTRWGLP